MCETSRITYVSIDFKRSRVRIYKESLHLIGDPKYIQLMVNVDQRLVAIRGIDRDTRGSHAHKINHTKFNSEMCFEIYSQSFVSNLRSAFDGFEGDCTYRLTGTAFPNDRAVVFEISSMQKYES